MKKVLVIEDDSEVASLFRNRLLAQNYEVEYAPDGQTGYYAIYDTKPDVVLIDLSIPQMDAVTLVGKIRAQKKFQKLPMFMLADSCLSDNAEEAIAAGATNIFNKADPNAVNEIMAALGQLFNPFLKNGRFPDPSSKILTQPGPAPSGNSLISPPRVIEPYSSLAAQVTAIDAESEQGKKLLPAPQYFYPGIRHAHSSDSKSISLLQHRQNAGREDSHRG